MIDDTRRGLWARRTGGLLQIRLLALAVGLLLPLSSGQAAQAAGLTWPTSLELLLNGAGRKLLAESHRLRALLEATVSGGVSTSRSVTITVATSKKRK